MNGMNFKPFISKVLDSLSDENLSVLASLIGSHSNIFKHKSIDGLTSDDKGVSLMTLQLDEKTFRTGYLLYNNSYCVLLSYSSTSERITEFKIDIATKTYEVVKEYLTTDYLRHEVAIRTSGVSSADVVAALVGQDINVEGITSKGIANTGNIANIGDIGTTGAITGKTLKQSEPNREYTSGITYNAALSEVQGGYAGVKEINGILYLIISKKFEVLSNMGANNLATIPLPEELLNKINVLDNAFTSGTVFCDSGAYQKTGNAASTLSYKITKGANALNIDLQTNVALVQGNVVEIFIRTFIALI